MTYTAEQREIYEEGFQAGFQAGREFSSSETADRAVALERGSVDAQNDEEGYNGWSNRETWALNLHLSNDQGLAEATREQVTESHNSHLLDTTFAYGDWSAEDCARVAVSKAADDLRDWVDNLLSNEDDALTAETAIAMLRDIGSLWRVNWLEVTEAFLER